MAPGRHKRHAEDPQKNSVVIFVVKYTSRTEATRSVRNVPRFPPVSVEKPMATFNVVTVTLSMTQVKLISRGATAVTNGMNALTTDVLTKLSTNYGNETPCPLLEGTRERPPLY